MSYENFKSDMRTLILKEITDQNKFLIKEIGEAAKNLQQAIDYSLNKSEFDNPKISKTIKTHLLKLETLYAQISQSEFIPQNFLNNYYQFAEELGLTIKII